MENFKTKVGAILLDTRSIQRYVFGCNQLITNTGASYLVDAIYNEAMIDVLKHQEFQNLRLDWQMKDALSMQDDETVDCEIAYIGGGNMLVLIRDDGDILDKCRKIVGDWSTRILIEAPGLKTGAAIGYMDLTGEGFQKSLDKLYEQLKENQNTIFPNVDLPYTGLTLECDFSGKTADVYYKKDGRLISAEVYAKILAYQNAVEYNKKLYEDVLGNEYSFCSELENIGYPDGESYISIIHIDGNNMGVKFSCCRTMFERKKLSKQVATIVKDAFKELLKSIVKEYDSYETFLDKKKLVCDGQKRLPLRPIIIGGDDVTFICPGRMGIEYAKRFIEYVNRYPLLDEDLRQRISEHTGKAVPETMSCCAGVAIVPAKYPFFRAYNLAEQLCGAAKVKSREEEGSYMDFAVLHGEMSGDLQKLREQQYQGVCGNLHYGPYDVLNEKSEIALNSLLSLQKQLKSLPSSKLKEMRNVLHEDLHSQQIFLEHCPKASKLPNDSAELWKSFNGESVTAYIDAIEITDFIYPCETGVENEAKN